jgi:hypothetical protein
MTKSGVGEPSIFNPPRTVDPLGFASQIKTWRGGTGAFDAAMKTGRGVNPKMLGRTRGGARGYGLYSADFEIPEVAESYARHSGGYPSIDKLREYFQPGKIVKSLWGRDKVIKFQEGPTESPYWNVLVQEINKAGEPIGRPRWHSTVPDSLRKGVVTPLTLHKGKKAGAYEYLRWDKPLTKDQRTMLRWEAERLVRTYEEARANRPTKFSPVAGGRDAKIGRKVLRYLEYAPTKNTAGRFYRTLSNEMGGDKKASEFLLRAGIDGMKYPAGEITGGATKHAKKGFDYVTYNIEDIFYGHGD